MTDLACPFCNTKFPDTQLLGDEFLTCIKCGRKANIFRLFWVQKGIKVDSKHQLRCPHCNTLFCEGDYSDREQVFKCKNCKNIATFQRIDPKEVDNYVVSGQEVQGSQG